jgi:signal transduction histidine kinase
MEKWTDISREDIVRTDLRSHFPRFNEDDYCSCVDKIIHGCSPDVLSSEIPGQVLHLKSPVGNARVLRISISAVPGYANNEYHALFSLEDVSELKKQIKDIKYVKRILKEETVAVTNTNIKLHREIEKRKLAQERTAKYATELEKTNKKLNASRQELEELLYTASHDLKAPIVSINGFARLLKDRITDHLDEKSSDYIERILASTETMEILLHDIMELSRIRSVEVESEEINTKDLISDIFESVSACTIEKNISLVCSGNLPNVFGRKKRITEAFSNLIDNAIKYMPDQESPFIEVGYDQAVDGPCGEHGAFYVRDNGKGIPEQFHSRVFSIFQHGPDKRDNPDSTSIGLAIVKKIIETHDGNIWLESTPMKGSTFYFTLPIISPGSNDKYNGKGESLQVQ